MAKTKFGYVYGTDKCPYCGNNLMDDDSVLIELTKGGRSWERYSRLTRQCVLMDPEDEVADGYHSETLCAACEESLVEYELQFIWEKKSQFNDAVAKALAVITNWPEA